MTCNNHGCIFTHPKGWVRPDKPQNPRACRWGANCNNPACMYEHPDEDSIPSSRGLCRHGRLCNNPQCEYTHPESRPEPDASLASNQCRMRYLCTNVWCRFEHPVDRVIRPPWVVATFRGWTSAAQLALKEGGSLWMEMEDEDSEDSDSEGFGDFKDL